MKEDRVYLQHILRCIARIEEYTSQGSLFSSQLIQDAVIRNLCYELEHESAAVYVFDSRLG